MTLDPFFVADVLEGIEGTLENVVERVEAPELRAEIDVLHARAKALRITITKTAKKNITSSRRRARCAQKS